MPTKDQVDNKTHYHYEYAFVDHRHYVNLKFLEGAASMYQPAYLAFQPFNWTVGSLPIEQSYDFVWTTPAGLTVKEQFHFDYTYTFH